MGNELRFDWLRWQFLHSTADTTHGHITLPITYIMTQITLKLKFWNLKGSPFVLEGGQLLSRFVLVGSTFVLGGQFLSWEVNFCQISKKKVTFCHFFVCSPVSPSEGQLPFSNRRVVCDSLSWRHSFSHSLKPLSFHRLHQGRWSENDVSGGGRHHAVCVQPCGFSWLIAFWHFIDMFQISQ